VAAPAHGSAHAPHAALRAAPHAASPADDTIDVAPTRAASTAPDASAAAPGRSGGPSPAPAAASDGARPSRFRAALTAAAARALDAPSGVAAVPAVAATALRSSLRRNLTGLVDRMRAIQAAAAEPREEEARGSGPVL
jgi:hypothetical protein